MMIDDVLPPIPFLGPAWRAEEIDIEIEKENKEKPSACVCLDDTQQTDYRQYEKYLSR